MTTNAELCALLAAATPGEWRDVSSVDPAQFGDGYVAVADSHVMHTVYRRDAALIVALHNEAPRLLDDNARLREQIEYAMSLLKLEIDGTATHSAVAAHRALAYALAEDAL